ncbi:hypothetical protein CDAR_507361 [Caerostris darwini]|uniref:Uncharacterized protein n=1 Tax=Caerostris darwini TaxID=1538125 RepID=A0AAV4WBD0_9ARAC|nr:hypothetical protein CDAR_507361 [Caerostris darwini]
MSTASLIDETVHEFGTEPRRRMRLNDVDATFKERLLIQAEVWKEHLKVFKQTLCILVIVCSYHGKYQFNIKFSNVLDLDDTRSTFSCQQKGKTSIPGVLWQLWIYYIRFVDGHSFFKD